MITIYRHRRLDTNEVFYVGIGKTEKRAYSKRDRNKHWKHIVNKVGYSVEIIAKVDTWELACELEQFLIQEYGRKDLGTGHLVNMTDGGDGMLGHKPSKETREKMSDAKKGYIPWNKGKTHSDETKKKLSKAHTGKKHTEETLKKMSLSKKGENNHKAKKVINTETGVIYNTIKEAAEKENINYSTLNMMLSGRRRNKTSLILIENEH